MSKPKSLLRFYQFKCISDLEIDGRILDVGGSKKSGYANIIKGNHSIVVGNIDASYDIDVLMDAEKIFPFEDETFDAVLMINVLEHLYDYKNAVSESFRILKPGGRLIGSVPFLINVHGSPSDYFRYTRFALERILLEPGFSSKKVVELGTGAWSVIFHLLFGFYKNKYLARIAEFIFTNLDKFFNWAKPGNLASSRYMPLGYYFEAKK